MPELASTRAVARSNLLLAGAVATALLVAYAVLAPHLSEPLLGPPGFTFGMTGMTFLVDLLTALLLLGQAQIAGELSTFRMGTAFLFSSAMAVCFLLVTPGIFGGSHGLLGFSPSAVWVWCAWHAGFALLVARYALTRGSPSGQTIRALPTLLVVAAAAAIILTVAARDFDRLPTVIDADSYARLNQLGIGPALIVINLVALLLVCLRLRQGGTLALWFAVASLAASVDTSMALLGGARMVVGWYAGRVGTLLTGLIMLLSLLAETLKLYRAMHSANLLLSDLASTDGLTLLGNRRFFDVEIAREWRRARRDGADLALLLLDIDHFKAFNDTYGHQAGDLCLQRVSSALRSALMRPGDVAFRYGGEEFVVLLPSTTVFGAMQIGERVREAISSLAIPHEKSPLGRVTISVGAATIRPRLDLLPLETLIMRADEALYAAKRGGRNTICGPRIDAGPTMMPALSA